MYKLHRYIPISAFHSKTTLHTVCVLSKLLIGKYSKICKTLSPEVSLCSLCTLSELMTDIQENVEAFPGESVTEINEITGLDIAKEGKVESETQESIESPTVPG